MGKKNEKQVKHTRKEEKQGIKVLVGIGIAAIVLAALMILASSTF